MRAKLELAQFSDWTFASAVAVYALALLLFAAELAASRVAVRAAAGDARRGAGVALDERPGHRSVAVRVGRSGVALTCLAAALHAASVVLRGVATVRAPWGNMYEFISVIGLAAVVAWLLAQRRHAVRRTGVFVLLPVLVLLFLGGTALYVDAGPVMPALQSYWLAIHVAAAALASGVLMVAGVASLLEVLRRRADARPARPGRFGRLADVLPPADRLDRVAYRTTVFAFPIWTFAIIAGAVWAEAAWGRFWGWDPKETTAFVAWVVYAGYLHARSTAGWRGGAAWVNVAGLAVMIFNLFFVNLVVAGLHSYAGVR